MKPENSLHGKLSDRKLGMDQPISRRDILHGIGVLTAGAMLPAPGIVGHVLASTSDPLSVTATYPPGLSGLRGDHPGSYEVSHQMARAGKRDWGPVIEPDAVVYDLIVVGAGLSGLSAAHFYQKQHPQARILILDNHDDFGGHATRNEFRAGGRSLIGYGGAQSLEEPSAYSHIVKGLLDDLSVDIKRFNSAYDQKFYKRSKLSAGMYFSRDVWGVDKTVAFDMGILEDYVPLLASTLSVEAAVAQMPISPAAKDEFVRLLLTDEDQIPEVPADEKWDYLYKISYRDFLHKHLDIREPEVFKLLQDLASDSGVGIEAVPAASALSYSGLPGWDAAGLPEPEHEEAYIHHFPDGNASIARLLVRKLIPAVAAGSSMEDVVTARFDYSKLDEGNSPVRLRLDSTVVKVVHDQDPINAKRVLLTYVRDGQACRVQARACVLACNNSSIPYLCPELPEPQREALAFQVRTPILYTNVALRNWRAWENMGIGGVIAPGGYHINAMLDFPVSIGDYAYSRSADEPVVVHMERFPHRSNQGLTAREQYRLGRQELLSTSFETIERNVRNQLAGMLEAGGFDPARDIVGITVNRWAHGYSYWYNPLFDTVYENDNDERYPHMLARKRFGRIAIANSDAAANAMFESAVEQGYRAVHELDQA
jgi:spermidine dehydrogenase